jgi:hypothetical protein
VPLGASTGVSLACSGPADDRIYRGTTPATQTLPFEFMDRNRRGRSRINNRQLHAHTFLSGGSAPLGLDEDDTVVMSMETPMADEDDGTYKTLGR